MMTHIKLTLKHKTTLLYSQDEYGRYIFMHKLKILLVFINKTFSHGNVNKNFPHSVNQHVSLNCNVSLKDVRKIISVVG